MNDNILLKDELKSTRHKEVIFHDSRWFIMKKFFNDDYSKHEKSFVMCKFIKNYYTLDYHANLNSLLKVKSLSEAKILSGILGIELWAPSHVVVFTENLSCPMIMNAKRLI